jgi:hypothetical protein
MASVSGIANIIPTLCAGFSQWLRTAFRGFYWLNLRFGVIVATLGVDFSASCHMTSRGSSALNMAFFCGIATIGVAALSVGLPASFLMASRVLS